MNPSSTSMSLILADYHKKAANLRLKILKSEEERIELEQKLRSISTIDSRLEQRRQIEDIQSYFTKLNEESQRARQRNLKLLNDLTQAEHNLNQLRIDTEHLLHSKHDYLQYLETSYLHLQEDPSTETHSNINNNPYKSDNTRRQRNDGNLLHSGK